MLISNEDIMMTDFCDWKLLPGVFHFILHKPVRCRVCAICESGKVNLKVITVSIYGM